MIKYTEIKGLSEEARLPRVGKIRLGLKMQHPTKRALNPETKKQEPITYPKEVPYFVVPEEVAEVYGPEPRELDILLPVNDRRIIFPQSYRMYGRNGLKCQGNGEVATFTNEQYEYEDRECPCEHYSPEGGRQSRCKRMGVLMAILPKVTMSGVFQITTSSVNSIIDINSGLKYCLAMLGRFAWVPLKLRRVETKTLHRGQPGLHYTLSLVPDINYTDLAQLQANSTRMIEYSSHYSVEDPDLTNPEEDPVDVVQEEPAASAPPAGEKQRAKAETKTSRKTPEVAPGPPAHPETGPEPTEPQGGHNDQVLDGEFSEVAEPVPTAGGGGGIDWSTPITGEHYNELIALQSKHRVLNIDELLFERGMPAFNQDLPDALFDDISALILSQDLGLPFDLLPLQELESPLDVIQAKVIDGKRAQAGIQSLAPILHELTGSSNLMKVKISQVKRILDWIQENGGKK